MTSGDEEAGGPAETPVVTGEVVQAAEGKIQKALRTSARDAAPLPPHLRNLPEQQEHQDMQLKREYAGFIKRALLGELVASNAIFVAYAWAGRHLELAASRDQHLARLDRGAGDRCRRDRDPSSVPAERQRLREIAFNAPIPMTGAWSHSWANEPIPVAQTPRPAPSLHFV